MERKKEVIEPEITLEILCESKDNPEQPGTFFLDEEALFNMPGLLESMAEGLILTPPARKRGFDWDDLGCDLDLTLDKLVNCLGKHCERTQEMKNCI